MWIYYMSHLLMIFILFNIILVIETWNPIFAIYHLVMVFLFTALLLLLLGAEFLALNIIILYVGAIAILFLFVIMMLNMRVPEKENNMMFNFNTYLGVLMSLKFWTLVFWTLESMNMRNHWWFYNQDPSLNIIYNLYYNQDVFIFGYLLYKPLFFIFLMCGLLLLISMVCSLILILRLKKKKNFF